MLRQQTKGVRRQNFRKYFPLPDSVQGLADRKHEVNRSGGDFAIVRVCRLRSPKETSKMTRVEGRQRVE